MENKQSFQDRLAEVHVALFDGDPTDIEERRARFFEEAGETVQAFGMTEDEAVDLVRYTWSRPVGEPEKEVGAAFVTLTSLCILAGISASDCAERDLEKLSKPETIARIRAKRSTRHGRGPLPGLDPSPAPQPQMVGIRSMATLTEQAVEILAKYGLFPHAWDEAAREALEAASSEIIVLARTSTLHATLSAPEAEG